MWAIVAGSAVEPAMTMRHAVERLVRGVPGTMASSIRTLRLLEPGLRVLPYGLHGAVTVRAV